MTTIGDRLKEIQRQYGVNQLRFAEMLGVSQSTVSGYQIGRSEPGATVLGKLVEHGVNSHWLLTGEGEPFSGRQPEKQVLDPVHPQPAQERSGRIDAGMWLEVKAAVRMAHRRATGTEISDIAADAIAVRYYNKAIRNGIQSQNIDNKYISALMGELEQEFGFIAPDVSNTAKHRA